MPAFFVFTTLWLAAVAQNVTNVKDPGLQQAAHGLSWTVRAVPSNVSAGSVREPGLQQAARGSSAAEREASSSTRSFAIDFHNLMGNARNVSASIEKGSLRDYRQSAGNASAIDFHNLMVANASESVKSTFEDLWSGSWGRMEEVVRHSALVRNASNSGAGGATRKLRIRSRLSSRQVASDDAGVAAGSGTATAPVANLGARGNTSNAAELTIGNATAEAQRVISSAKSREESPSKISATNNATSHATNDTALEVAKKQSTDSAIHVPLGYSVKNVRDPTLQVAGASDFSAQHVENVRGGSKQNDTQAGAKVDTYTDVVHGSDNLPLGVLRPRTMVHKRVDDAVKASPGNSTHQVVKPSPPAVGTTVSEVLSVQVRGVRLIPETHADVQQPSAVRTDAERQHTGAKAKQVLRAKPVAPEGAHALDVSVSGDFLTSLDSPTLNGPLAKLLAAKHDFDSRARMEAERISQNRGRVANIRSNVDSLTAALASADVSASQ